MVIKDAYQRHIPYSIGYYVHCRFDNRKSFFRSSTDGNCIKWFADELYNLSTSIIAPILYNEKAIEMSAEHEIAFQRATHCHICEKKIYEDEIKVRDHSHITGKYRGAAHSNCNLKYKESMSIPVVFHNLNYDMHFLIETMTYYQKIRSIIFHSQNMLMMKKIEAIIEMQLN